MSKKTCFVLIGYGIKIDYPTGRDLNLERTFENLIKPVFDQLNIECFRAKDIPHAGVIDKIMYEWIFKADIVVADLSTLNPNVLYELGIRHAIKPFSTIIISEDKLNYPFDLNHINITPTYKHLGDDIGVSEANRFQTDLKNKVYYILDHPNDDSPVYSLLKDVQSSFSDEEIKLIEKSRGQGELSLSDIIDKAEKAKDSKQYEEAIIQYKEALKINPNNIFLIQRLALVTYKCGQPDEFAALKEAENILHRLNPYQTTDTETLGLMGAIYKRKFALNEKREYLDKAFFFYEKGFYIKQDYYNGINVAFLYTLRAAKYQINQNEAIADYIASNRVRNRVIDICKSLRESIDYNERGDKNWINFTLAEAYLGLNQLDKVKEIMDNVDMFSEGEFDKSSYYEQSSKLSDLIGIFKEKFGSI